ncbi:hypothetical protein [Paenibacillus pseudetheri]|uniref:Uncharacterized protein n=1 Tax=Paenibacillus pseudetheri TaxID=2897682 RepID=A0ABM9B8G1_9BACL|nr:hypothetical protein [Paenibacillus pseudetheri]CAH1054815.1 hypothetical protein PAECIP111894_00965 [Paenibacillus pseudetheri]
MISRKYWFLGCIGLLATMFCFSLTVAHAQTKSAKILERKIKILEKVQIQESYTQVLIGKLESDWPKLFSAKSVDDLFNKYAFITWYIDDDARIRLKAQLNKHTYYLEYEKLLKKGLLPAKKTSLKNLEIESYSSDIIAVSGTYDVILRDGSNKTFEVTLKAKKESLSYFSPMFNIEEGSGISTNSKDEELDLQYKFQLLNSIDTIRKLSKEQLYFLFDLRMDQ